MLKIVCVEGQIDPFRASQPSSPRGDVREYSTQFTFPRALLDGTCLDSEKHYHDLL